MFEILFSPKIHTLRQVLQRFICVPLDKSRFQTLIADISMVGKYLFRGHWGSRYELFFPFKQILCDVTANYEANKEGYVRSSQKENHCFLKKYVNSK